MKTLLLRIAVLALSLLPLCAQAQTPAEVLASVKKMEAAASPCNQGAEPFRQFIAKFNTDSTFMASRLLLDDAKKAKYAALLVPGNFEARKPFAKNGEQFYQAWGETQRNKVYLDCGWVDSYVEHIFEFVRKGEKWYLGNIVVDE